MGHGALTWLVSHIDDPRAFGASFVVPTMSFDFCVIKFLIVEDILQLLLWVVVELHPDKQYHFQEFFVGDASEARHLEC